MLNNFFENFKPKVATNVYEQLDLASKSKLRTYLKKLKVYSSFANDSNEIYLDILGVISEKVAVKFTEKGNRKLQLTELDKIIAKIGTPEEILSNNDIDIKQILKSNPIASLTLRYSAFIYGEDRYIKAVALVTSLITVIITIALIVSFYSLSSDARMLYRLDIDLASSKGEYLKLLTLTWIPLLLLSITSLIHRIKDRVANNLMHLTTVTFFLISILLSLFMYREQTKSLLLSINDFKSTSQALEYANQVEFNTKSEIVKQIDLQIKADQINDIPNIYIINSNQKTGAVFNYPSEFKGETYDLFYEDIDLQKLTVNYDATEYRSSCGLTCFYAKGSRPSLYIYVNDSVKVKLNYAFEHNSFALQNFDQLNLEVYNLESLDLEIYSSRYNSVLLKSIGIKNADISINQTVRLEMVGHFENINISAKGFTEFLLGGSQYDSNHDFMLTYNGYAGSFANIAYGNEVILNLDDGATALYSKSGIKNLTINTTEKSTAVDSDTRE